MSMVLMLRARSLGAALGAVVVLPLLAGCGDDGDASTTPSEGALRIEASFYPLAWMAEQVGGDHVTVDSLTEPGAEPHDLELTPSDVATVSDADLIVYLSGFQPAVDDAVAEADGDAVFDAAASADLDLTFTPIDEGEEHADEAGSVDPHFWLDPTRLAAVADAFADKLSEIDPDNADDFAANLAVLTDRLDTLDRELMTGLADCANTDLVTSHNAFGYLARRYGLTQVGITGLTPEEEPSPADLAAVTRFVEDNDVRTIYFETLVSPDVANTVAAEAGATTEVLDPIEGLNDESQGRDYVEVMTANLANLQRGQSCP
jgi:zinc transport system substrate-binding protein